MLRYKVNQEFDAEINGVHFCSEILYNSTIWELGEIENKYDVELPQNFIETFIDCYENIFSEEEPRYSEEIMQFDILDDDELGNCSWGREFEEIGDGIKENKYNFRGCSL